MKKVIIILSSIIILAAASVIISIFIFVAVNWFNPNTLQDKTDNVNVMLSRADNWRQVIDNAIMPEENMSMIDGSTATIPITAEILRQFYNYTDDDINASDYVFHSTTHNAYEALIKKEPKNIDKNAVTSLIFVTPPSENEKAFAKSKKVALDIEQIAKDAFVFITHISNPVESLTIEQVQKIYSGEITNWKEVGGEDLEIIAYQREPNSGSQTAMEQIVMKGKTMIPPIEATLYGHDSGMGVLIDVIAEYKNGKSSIGYTYNYYLNNLYKNSDIKTLRIDDIPPDNDNVANTTYPFTTEYVAIIRKDEPTDSYARILRDFLITDKGQNLIEMAGYCRRDE